MKKGVLFTMLLLATATIFAQSLDDVTKFMYLGKNKNAKEAIDKFLSDAKNANKAEAWYYKGRIYNASSKDSGLSISDALNLKADALEAFKKYQQLDAKEKNLVDEKYVSFFDLYNGYFDIGAKEFNNKNFASSFQGFKNALAVEEYVKSKGYEYNGFKFSVLDTSLITNIAIAATQAKDEESAVLYYKKLTDANLSADQFLSVYQYLVEYYLKKKDDANLNAILEKGKNLYPKEPYWTDIELEKVSKTGDKKALMDKYEELIKRFPDNFTYPYNLSVELYNQIYNNGDTKVANANALKAKLTDIIKTAIALDKNCDAKMLMTRHLYQDAYDYRDSAKSIKGAKPADIKLRNDLKAIYLKKLDDCIPYALSVTDFYAALPTLKPVQKANYRIVLDLLSQMYTTKNDLKKAAEYDKKKADLDTK